MTKKDETSHKLCPVFLDVWEYRRANPKEFPYANDPRTLRRAHSYNRGTTTGRPPSFPRIELYNKLEPKGVTPCLCGASDAWKCWSSVRRRKVYGGTSGEDTRLKLSIASKVVRRLDPKFITTLGYSACKHEAILLLPEDPTKTNVLSVVKKLTVKLTQQVSQFSFQRDRETEKLDLPNQTKTKEPPLFTTESNGAIWANGAEITGIKVKGESNLLPVNPGSHGTNFERGCCGYPDWYLKDLAGRDEGLFQRAHTFAKEAHREARTRARSNSWPLESVGLPPKPLDWYREEDEK